MPYERRDIVGGAVSTTLVGTVTALDVSWLIVDATGWPLGTNGPFYAVFDRGLASEEKVLCQSLSGTTVTLTDSSFRGQDGTTATTHAAPATFEHCSTGVDGDEANLAVTQTVGQIQDVGDLLTGGGGNVLQRTAIGADGLLLLAASTQPGGVIWGDLPEGSVSNRGQIADGLINDVRIFANAAARDAAISSPVVGDACFLTDHATPLFFNGATVGWTPQWNLPWGQLARRRLNVTQTNADNLPHIITGLAETYTQVLNRAVEVKIEGTWRNLDPAAYRTVTVALQDGVTPIDQPRIFLCPPNAPGPDVPISFTSQEFTLTPGPHTINPTQQQGASSAGCAVVATNFPAVITISDVGPAGDPS